MLSNIIYKFSAFADYSVIKYSQENISQMLAVFADKKLLPGMVMQSAPEGLSQRIQLINVEHTMTITVLRERIDIEIYSNKREGFSEQEVSMRCEEMANMMQEIYALFEEYVPDAWRLAWNVSYAYFDISQDEKNVFRSKFLKELPFYQGSSTDEFIAQYAGIVSRNVGAQKEDINVLTTITRLYKDAAEGFAVDGYKIDFDINTHQEKRKNRFRGEVMSEFITMAVEIQNTLIGEVVHDCK